MSQQLDRSLARMVADTQGLNKAALDFQKKIGVLRQDVANYATSSAERAAEAAASAESTESSANVLGTAAQAAANTHLNLRDNRDAVITEVRAGVANARASKNALGIAKSAEEGDMTPYLNWLTASPVALGTLLFSFGDVRPAAASLTLDFSAQDFQVWETSSQINTYE